MYIVVWSGVQFFLLWYLLAWCGTPKGVVNVVSLIFFATVSLYSCTSQHPGLRIQELNTIHRIVFRDLKDTMPMDDFVWVSAQARALRRAFCNQECVYSKSDPHLLLYRHPNNATISFPWFHIARSNHCVYSQSSPPESARSTNVIRSMTRRTRTTNSDAFILYYATECMQSRFQCASRTMGSVWSFLACHVIAIQGYL